MSTARDAWYPWSKKYVIDDETLAVTQHAIDAGFKSFHELTPEAANRQFSEMFHEGLDLGPFDGTITDLTVPSKNVAAGIPITVFKPSSCPEVPVILIYYHGGGLVVLNKNMYNYCVRSLANKSKAIVVNVEYRLLPCPDDPLAPFNDAVDVARWVLGNKEAVGGRSQSIVGVAGDSAGGQISCSVTNDVRDIAFQVLAYPVTDVTCDLPSFEEFKDIPAFNTRAMEAMFDMYLPLIPDAASNARVNPSATVDLGASPPTLIILAQLDPLLDWGVTYARRLREAGVRVKEVIFEGVPHGFFTLLDFPKNLSKAHDVVAEFIRSFQ